MNQMDGSVEPDASQPSLTDDRAFDAFRAPRSEAAKHVVTEVIRQIESYERYKGLRKRSRKKVDQVIFEQTIAAVVCDVIHRFLEDPSGAVAVSRSNRDLGRQSRYRSLALGKTLPALLERLSAPEMDFVSMTKGGRREVWDEDGVVHSVGRQTTLQAGPSLIRRIEEWNLGFDDLGRSEAEEIIILKGEKTRGESGDRLEYEDTPDTLRYRSDLRSINAWLAEADLELHELTDTPTDTSSRRLRRVFNNGSFTQGGRLFGGFWQTLKKEVRRKDLTIEGEPVAELDYGQMALRLLYGKVGAVPPPGDLYDIPSLPSREGAKKLINSALYASKEQVRMPQGSRKYFPDDVTYDYALSTIARHHAPISEYFFTGAGMELMFLESEVMIDVLLCTRDQGRVALPIHDGVLTSRSAVPVVKTIMEDVFREKVGIGAPVTVEMYGGEVATYTRGIAWASP